MRSPTSASRPRMAQRRDAQPRDAAGGREHQAFGQHLAHQAAALGAERGAQADLALARRAARQQQVGDVDAGDEQHQRDRADQREQRRAQLADQLFLQREDHHRAAGIELRLFLLELGVDGSACRRRPARTTPRRAVARSRTSCRGRSPPAAARAFAPYGIRKSAFWPTTVKPGGITPTTVRGPSFGGQRHPEHVGSARRVVAARTRG